MTTMPTISYDADLMFDARIGKAGVPVSRVPVIASRLEAVRKELQRQRDAGETGFFSVPERRKDAKEAKDAAARTSRAFRTLVVIGIGGSDLGARALVRALPPRKGMDVRFIGANTDPDEIAALLAELDLRRTALNIVSKSGNTIEPMSTFLVLRDRLIRKVGKGKHARHVIATTDKAKGTLRAIADREGYATLPVPDDIGGRFSALTPVGLFPAACAGIDIMGLLSGAKEVRDAFFSRPAEENGPLLFAGLHHDAYAARDQHITVLMPYAAALDEFGKWFRQLWAESLGKKIGRDGRTVHHGLTPVAALGATDQHSQVQLYNEGPFDKVVTFVEVDRFRNDLAVPAAFPDIEGVAYLRGLRFDRIIRAEREATARALAADGRPNGTIRVPAITPRSVGGLMMFFMLATAAMGELLDVDAYDQPGVEAGKRTMYALLGRRGYSLE